MNSTMTSFTPKDHMFSKQQKLITNQLLKKRIAELDRMKYPTDYKINNRVNENHLDEIQSQLSEMKTKSPNNFMNRRNISLNNSDDKNYQHSTLSNLNKAKLDYNLALDSRSRATNSCLAGRKFIRREMDYGNPRYAASRQSSFCGNLITGRHTTDGFY